MSIKFTTINVNGVAISRNFMSVEEMRKDWWDERGTTLPSNDDELVSASIDGVEFKGTTFEDLANHLDLNNNNFDCLGKYGVDKSCEYCCNAEKCKELTTAL